jgi:hypothetical protein
MPPGATFEDEFTSDTGNALSTVLNKVGRLAEAETLFRERLALMRRIYGNDDSLVFAATYNLALTLSNQTTSPRYEQKFSRPSHYFKTLYRDRRGSLARTTRPLAASKICIRTCNQRRR